MADLSRARMSNRAVWTPSSSPRWSQGRSVSWRQNITSQVAGLRGGTDTDSSFHEKIRSDGWLPTEYGLIELA
jgi:hypothetical protein